MSYFNPGETDDLSLTEEFHLSGGSPETPENLPAGFFLVKDIQERGAEDSHLDIFLEFAKSLPAPYDGISLTSAEKILSQGFERADVIQTLNHALLYGAGSNGSFANDEDEAKEMAARILEAGEPLENIYCSYLAPATTLVNPPTLYHFCEISFFFVWKDRCALLTIIGWD